jgi:queuine tRNA-ribosyltransferase
MRVLQTSHGDLRLPAFLPDATRGVVKALDATDLIRSGIRACMVNTLHLSNRPGTKRIARLGGVHSFMGWDGPVASDSGGFQVYSLASQPSGQASVSSRGFTYRRGPKDRKHLLTPEKCIQWQFDLGSDVLFCLDHCTHPDEPEQRQRQSVQRTVAWAKRCRCSGSSGWVQ